jgi:hypothetical protein
MMALRARGSKEMSRWCNHRNHADTPFILRCALEGSEKGTKATQPSNPETGMADHGIH